jgi:hypothetical protein
VDGAAGDDSDREGQHVPHDRSESGHHDRDPGEGADERADVRLKVGDDANGEHSDELQDGGQPGDEVGEMCGDGVHDRLSETDGGSGAVGAVLTVQE